MNRLDAMERIAQRRGQQFLHDRRVWEARQERQYTAFFTERMRQELADEGPDGKPWGTMLPRGLRGRDLGLQDIRIRCWARIKARRYVRGMREWEWA